jgi:hypothetical protein
MNSASLHPREPGPVLAEDLLRGATRRHRSPEIRAGRTVRQAPRTAQKEKDVAEIRVERRQRSSLLPWILGLVLLGLLIWALASMLGNDDTREIESDAAEAGTISLPEPRFRQVASLTEPAEEPCFARAA